MLHFGHNPIMADGEIEECAGKCDIPLEHLLTSFLALFVLILYLFGLFVGGVSELFGWWCGSINSIKLVFEPI